MFVSQVSVRYHLHLFKTWRTTDQKVRLQVSLPGQVTHSQQTPPTNSLFKGTNKETMV